MIEIKNLKIRVGEFTVYVENLSLKRGEYLVIVGPTGSGKTLLLETIAGFYSPLKGEIILNGTNITELPPNKRNVAIVYQDFMLFPHMSVMDNIGYPLKLKKAKDWKSKVIEISKELEIQHLLSRMPNTLSGGEKQRVAIARAVMLEPDILLLDEPFSALDVNMKDSARRLIRDFIKHRKLTTIHVTHDFMDAWIMGNKLAVMRNGKMVQVGSVDEVFANPREEFVARFLGSTNMLRGRIVDTAEDMSVIEIGGVKIYSADRAEKGADVLVSIRPENIVLSPTKFISSLRNMHSAVIENLERSGHIVWITLNINGMELKAMLTPNAVETLGIKKGNKVYVGFKATATRIVAQL